MKGSITSNPYDGRILMISNNMNSIGVVYDSAKTVAVGKQKDIEKLEERMKKIDNRIRENEELHRKRVALLSDSIERLCGMMNEDKSTFENEYEVQYNRVTKIERMMNEGITNIDRVGEDDAE